MEKSYPNHNKIIKIHQKMQKKTRFYDFLWFFDLDMIFFDFFYDFDMIFLMFFLWFFLVQKFL